MSLGEAARAGRGLRAGRGRAPGQPEHAVRPLGAGARRRCSTGACWASRCWRRSRCGRSRTGCPGPRDGRSLSTFIMSIHHLDTFRYWLGDPDPRPGQHPARPADDVRPRRRDQPLHPRVRERRPGLGLGRRLGGPGARGGRRRASASAGGSRGPRAWPWATIGWPGWPERVPSTIDYSTIRDDGAWHRPRWPEAWFPDAFAGTMAGLARGPSKRASEPDISGPGQPQDDRPLRGRPGRRARASRGATRPNSGIMG